ncbi:MAG: hypothetical protein V3R25_09945 [Nitrosomonadaceae bacterium]
MAFDPDEYLAGKASGEFDPDAYLSSRAGPLEGIPTAADMPENNIAPAPEMSGMDIASGVADIALGAGYGIGKEAVSGLAGLAMSPTSGAQAVEATQQALPDYPISRQGLEIVGALSQKYKDIAPEYLQNIVSDAMQLGESIGSKTLEATGSPLLATGAQMIPAALEAATGLTGGRQAARAVGDVAQSASALPSPQRAMIEATQALPSPEEAIGRGAAKVQQAVRPSKKAIREAIESESGDKIAAGYDVTPYGAVVENPLEQAALSQGFDQDLIGALKTATPKDRAAMLEMTAIRKRGTENYMERIKNRPAKVAGNSLLERYNVVRKANRQSGRDVDKASRNLAGKQVDTDELTENFATSLGDKLSVRLTPEGSIDFTDSIIEKNPAARRALSDLVDLMGRGGAPDAERLHFMKKYIDDNVTFGKAKDGLAGDTERIMKDLRYDINQAIRDVDPDYAAANDAYSETIGAIDEFQSLMGNKVDLSGANASEAVGRNLRKVMSNYNTRENLLDSITSIEELAIKHGGEFSDNIILQAGYAQKLDDMFGAVADTSLRGAAGGAIRDTVRGDLLGAAGNLASGAVKKFKRQTDEKAFNAINDLLKQAK